MNNESNVFIFGYLSTTSILLPFICCLINKKAFNKQFKAMFIYVCFSILCELFDVLGKIHGINIIPVDYIDYIFTLVETSIIMYMFSTEMNKPFFQKLIRIIYSIFISISLLSFIIKDIQFADLITISLQAPTILIFSGIFFYNIFTDLTIPKLTDYSFFWFNSAFLLFFGSDFLIRLFNSYIQTCNKEVWYLLGYVHFIWNLIYNILLAIGIWKLKKV